MKMRMRLGSHLMRMRIGNLWVMGEGSPSLSKSSDNIDDTRGKANLEGEGGKGKGSQGGLQVELSSVTNCVKIF